MKTAFRKGDAGLSIKLSRVDAVKHVRRVALSVYEDLDTPVSLSCYLLLKNGEGRQLAAKRVDPANYLTASDYAKDNAAVSFLRKAEFGLTADSVTKEERQAAALAKFLSAREACKKFNDSMPAFWGTLTPELREVNTLARRKIADILGDVPNFADLPWRFGPGATLSVKRLVALNNKLKATPECPLHAVEQVLDLLENEPRWLSGLVYGDPFAVSSRKQREHASEYPFLVGGPFSVVGSLQFVITEADQLAFVPKTSEIDRVIRMQPTHLVPLQLAAGGYIRNRLRRVGLNLEKQADFNRKLARRGSIDGKYATIDLESASDTISIALVYDLLPYDWAHALSRISSHRTRLPSGEVLDNEEFSSMGNGFTFELETLLFYALAKSAVEVRKARGAVSVFGDDIIVPTSASDLVLEALVAHGFKPNPSKTFTSGAFRESCGHDYFNGVQTRGIHVKSLPVTVQDLYKLANQVRILAERTTPTLRRSWLNSLSLLKKEARYYGPRRFGNAVIHSPNSETHWARHLYGSITMTRTKAVVWSPRERDSWTLLAGLHPISPLPSSQVGGVIGFETEVAPVSWQELDDVPPWLS